MIEKIESAPVNSLVLIEEIENGLHPVATRRMVEYLIDVAARKGIQSIFTTHSDFALEVLPNEAIWACLNGSIRQGRLTIEALRAVSGRVDQKIAIFVEDEFAKYWVDAIIREKLGMDGEQVSTYYVAGDGNAINTHRSHNKNPSIGFKSMCVLDGDSAQPNSEADGVLRLPGKQPELTVYSDILDRLDSVLALVTVSCQRAPESQTVVERAIRSVITTNRDPHVQLTKLELK